MIKHKDGSISGLEVVRPATMPPNEKQHDSLLNATEMSKEDAGLLSNILKRVIETHYA